MDYETHTLSNGIRIIHLKTSNVVAHLGLMVSTGSRDESDQEHGMAHLIEHLVFKGTEKRKAFHIISRMEDVGGEINAYTTKEETCIYTSFMKSDYPRAFELLQDVVFHSIYPQKELTREKNVIIDEINSYQDNPGELIFDDFEEFVFLDHPIGRNILGSPNTLKTFSRKDILYFISNNYATDEMVICSVGNITSSRLFKMAVKYVNDIPAKSRKKERSPIKPYNHSRLIKNLNTFQSHTIVGNRAYAVQDKRRVGLHLLINLLGGPGLNTRLNMTLREKNGYSYHTESHYTPYSDTGIVNVYFSSDKEKIDKSKKVVMREFGKLRKQKLGSLQLSKAKKQLMGQIAIGSENHENLMLNMAKSFLIFNEVDGLEEIQRKIDAVSAEELMDIANEILDENNLSILTYK